MTKVTAKSTSRRAAKRCPTCGEGKLKYVARKGRMWSFKGFDYPIPADVKLVECTHCHEMPMTPAEVNGFERPIAEAHRKRMAALVDESLRVLEPLVPVGQIEKDLHLSQGYLARARTKGEPSFQLAALLKIIAEDPTKLDSIAKLANRRRA